MISPLWLRPAVGQLFRGGIDYRSYVRQIVLLGLFKRRRGDLGVIEGAWRTWYLPPIGEAEWVTPPGPDVTPSQGPAKVRFDAGVYNFAQLNGWNRFLYDELRLITRERHLAFADSWGEVPVGVNIRCGNDFRPPPLDPNYSRVGWLQKTPLSWFVETLTLIRQAVGYPVRALVVSDGTEGLLKDILEMENVVFLRPGSAISDLLVLSRSRILLASASSTFSAWAAFFGEMPTVTAPGHPLTKRGIEPLQGQFIGEFDPRDPSQAFLAQATARLTDHFSHRGGF